MSKLYGMTDELFDELVQSGRLFEHQEAMTKEGLRNKAAIAYELAKRDREIDMLKNRKQQQLYDAVALVFKHEEDFIKTFEDAFDYEVYAIDGFWMSGTNCLVKYIRRGICGSWPNDTVFIQTEDFLDWLEGKS